METNNQEIVISELKSEESTIRYLRNQRKIGFFAGLIGLLSFFIGFVIFIYFSKLHYFGVIMFVFGLLKSIIYFSKYFVTKTRLTINTELFNLDKDSYLIEQQLNSKRTYNYYQKLMFGYGIGILILTYSLVYLPLSTNGLHALLAILIHGLIAFAIYYCELINAKSVVLTNFPKNQLI